ncbi:MAG: hypothetical protein R3F17_03570 [Planctomycetota bacterium]
MSQDDFDDVEVEEGGGSPFDPKVLLLYGAWRSKHWIGLTTALGTVAGLVVAAAMPNVYRSEGMLDYRPGLAEALTDRQIVATGMEVPGSGVPGMDNELTLLNSIEPYKRVARELGPAYVLGKPDPTEDDEDSGILTRLWHGFQKTMIGLAYKSYDADQEVTEKAILGAARSLRARTELYVPLKSHTSIITVRHDGFSPERAETTAQAILRALQDFHLEIYASQTKRDLAETSLAVIEDEIRTTADELKAHTAECGFKNITAERDAALERADEGRSRAMGLETDIAGLERKVAQLESALADTDEFMTERREAEMGPNPEYKFQQQIWFDLRLERENATGLTTQQLGALDNRIEAQKAKLDTIPELVEVSPAILRQVPNPSHSNLFSQATAAKSDLEGKRGELESLRRQIRDDEDRVGKMDECVEIHKTKQTLLDLKYGERDIARRRVQATKDQDILEKEGVSALLLRADASRPLEKTGPQRTKPLGAGIAGGLILGLILAVLRQFLDPTVRYRETVEKELDLPILVVVPESRALRRIKPGHVNVA